MSCRVWGMSCRVLTLSGSGIAYGREPGSSDPRDWRHRLHRGPARPAPPRGRSPRPVPRPRAAEARRATLGERPARGGRRGRHVRRRVAAAGHGRLRGGVLPRALDGGGGPRVRRARPRDGARRSPARPRTRGLERIVYLGGSARAGRRPLRAPRLAARGRGAPRVRADAGHRPARGHDHRLGLGVLRDPALPRGAAAGHGDAALGAARSRSRSRCATCCSTSWTACDVPGTSGRTLDIGGPDVLSLPRADADHGGGTGPAAALRDPGAGADAAAELALDPPRDADLAPHRASPGRGPAQPRRLPERRARSASCRRRCCTVREAIRAALDRVAHDEVETSWSMAGPIPGDPDWAGGTVFTDRRAIGRRARRRMRSGARCAHRGRHGWYAADGLWRLRGWLDRLVGGPGLRRGRRDPDEVGYGEALDFWRVTGIETDRRLSLRAEMKLPGEALLEFTVAPEGDGTRLDPDGPLPAAGPASASPTGTRSCRSTRSSSGGCSRAFDRARPSRPLASTLRPQGRLA